MSFGIRFACMSIGACAIAVLTGCSTCTGLHVRVVPQDDFRNARRAVPVSFFVARQDEVDALSRINSKQWFDPDQPGTNSERDTWQAKLGQGPDRDRLLTLSASPLELETCHTIESLPSDCVKLFVWAGYDDPQTSTKPEASRNIELAPLHKGFFFFLDRTCCVDVLIFRDKITVQEGDQCKRKSKT